MSAVQSSRTHANPKRVHEMCIFFTNDFKAHGCDTSRAYANISASIDQEIDNITKKPIDQDI